MKSYIGEGHDFIPLMSRSFNDFGCEDFRLGGKIF